jgi:SNF2 family DNA or RNA helicase
VVVAWLEDGTSLLVVDESSMIKNPSALRTKFIIKLGSISNVHYRRIMSGTPVTRGQENLFSQFKFLDPNILGHKSFTSFRSEYCIMGGFESRQIVGYKKTEELIKIVDGHSHRVLKRDCLDLPPKVYKRRPYEMSPKQRKLYDAYRKGVIDELKALLGEERALEKVNELVITKALRLQQIACGYMPDSLMEPIEEEKTERVRTTLEAVEEFGDNKLILWARFKPELRTLHKLLGDKAVGYYGGIDEKERISAIQRFVNSDKVRYIVGSSAMAYGHSLPAVGAIFHSQSSSLDIRLQSEDRCHGINRVIGPTATYVDLEAVRSVDKKIFKCLKENKQISDLVLQDPVSIFMEDEDGE